jgi:UDP:flavonoid glycosyltransferase YjiC (YdhE family)
MACLERLGLAVRVRHSRHPSAKAQKAVERLHHDDGAKEKAAALASNMPAWDGPELATQKIVEHFSAGRS